MILKNIINEKIEDKKQFTKDWSINKILNILELDNITDAINICIEKIKSKKYSTGTDWQGETQLYYHIENNNLLLTLDKNDFDKNSLDRYYFTFANDKEKIRVLFEITGELTMLEKFNF